MKSRRRRGDRILHKPRRGRGSGGGRMGWSELNERRGGVVESRFLFWNIAGLGRQDEEFWKFVEGHEFISLSETWVEDKGWYNIKGWLPGTHEWECVYASRERRRGRAKRGFILGKGLMR